jgi:hypothetical protein
MYRIKPIRRRHKPPPRAVIRSATAAFWSLAILALVVGGNSALLGAPLLIGIILPPGVVAAQASDAPHQAAVTLRIEPALPAGAFAPRLLDPVDPQIPLASAHQEQRAPLR